MVEVEYHVRCEDFCLLVHVERRKPVGEHIPGVHGRVAASNVPELDFTVQAIGNTRLSALLREWET